MKMAIIGGSGFHQHPDFKILEQIPMTTPFGAPSAPILKASLGPASNSFYFLLRHGLHHQHPPHAVPYRANLYALKQLGVTSILAVHSVGGIGPGMGPNTLILPHQVIDYTWGREHTYSFSSEQELRHIDFSHPFSEELRKKILHRAKLQNIILKSEAVYGCTQGPRLESIAEIQKLKKDGCHLVGQTAMPEAALARELNLDYVSFSIVANWAAGEGGEEGSETLSFDQIKAGMQQGIGELIKLLKTGDFLC